MSFIKRLVGLTLALGILAVPVVAAYKFQAITDWWKLRGYSPPAQVTKLADENTMSLFAKHLFYINHPDVVADAAALRKECPQGEQTIVLGCYHPIEQGIAIYDVQDDRLTGVEQVTAAHEMLHAAYDRLNAKEKNNLNSQLTDYYNNEVRDQRIINTINAYKKAEPNDVVNEMHSVFGTEIASLPVPLENYYKKYFSNRSTVVGFANRYRGEFTRRTNLINTDDAQLEVLKQQIDQEEQDLSSRAAKINSDRARLDSLRSAGKVDEYNSAVDSFNAEVNAYNSGVARLRRDITAYNQLVTDRNAIASELRGLQASLDTRLTAQAAQ